MAAGSGLLDGLLRLLPEVGGGFRRCRVGGAPPSLSSEYESGHYFSGGGPPSESEGLPLAQRQQRRHLALACFSKRRFRLVFFLTIFRAKCAV
jgi:hypothetical protein